MTDEEFKNELQDLVEMIESLRRIKDKALRPWLKVEIKQQLRRLIND